MHKSLPASPLLDSRKGIATAAQLERATATHTLGGGVPPNIIVFRNLVESARRTLQMQAVRPVWDPLLRRCVIQTAPKHVWKIYFIHHSLL